MGIPLNNDRENPTRDSVRPNRIWLVIPFVAFGVGITWLQSGWIALVVYHALIAVALMLNLKHWDWRDCFRGFKIGWAAFHLALVVAGYFLFVELANRAGFGSGAARTVIEAASGGWAMGFALYFCLVNPLFEEVFWRGLFARDERGIVIEDLLFGSFHILILLPFLGWVPAICVAFLLMGVAWCWRQLRTLGEGGLALPIWGHFLGDFDVYLGDQSDCGFPISTGSPITRSSCEFGSGTDLACAGEYEKRHRG